MIEIGIRDSETDRDFQIYVDPEDQEITNQSLSIHGLTTEFLKGKTCFRDAWIIVERWIEDQSRDRIPVIMAYNGKKFDFEVLRHALYKNEMSFSEKWYFTDPFLNLNHVVKPAVLNQDDLKLDNIIHKISDYKIPKTHTAT